MPYYVKITKKVRDAILPAYLVLRRTFDGNFLIYQSALERVEGNTLRERCDKVGGALLTPLEAKEEIAGTICKTCYTPEAYGGDDNENGISAPDAGMTGGSGYVQGAGSESTPNAGGESSEAGSEGSETEGNGEQEAEENGEQKADGDNAASVPSDSVAGQSQAENSSEAATPTESANKSNEQKKESEVTDEPE